MAEKEIQLLKEQIDKLNAKNFDLEAWKTYTCILLGKIFGDDKQKIDAIQEIEYDYSSWSLRDATGNSSNLDSCRKIAKEILVASIDELENFGLPEKESQTLPDDTIIRTALEDHLKMSEYREFLSIIKNDEEHDDTRSKLKAFLTRIGSNVSEDILLDIFTDPRLKSMLH